MAFNLPPVQSNQPNFFARQGTRVLTSQKSVGNLDEASAPPAFNVNPTRSKGNKLPSLTNIDQYDRPQTFVRKDEQTVVYDNRPLMEQQSKLIPSGFVLPQGPGLLRSPNNASTKKMTTSDMMPPQNIYGFHQNLALKNISFSENGTPKNYNQNGLLRPLLQPKSITPTAFQQYSQSPSSQLLPNINGGGYARPYNLFPGSNASFENIFGKKLEQQHKLLDKLMMRLGKEMDDSDGSDTESSKKKDRKLLEQQMARRRQKIQTVVLPLQQVRAQRIGRIQERGEAEECSPNIYQKGSNRGGQSNRSKSKNPGTLNYIDESLSPDGSLSPRRNNTNHRRDKNGSKSLNDLSSGLMSKRKLRRKNRDDEDYDSSGDESAMRKSSRKRRSSKSKTVRTKTNIMSSEFEPSIQFMSRRGRRDLAQARLRVVGWSLVYYRLLNNNIKNRVLKERDMFLRNISENIFNLSGILTSYILQTAGRQIQEMITNKSYDYIFVSDKMILPKKLEKECESLYICYKNILDRLFTFTKTLPDHLFGLLAAISEEGSQLPHDYFSEFELRRQQFTYFGKLKFVTAAKSKLLIGGVLLRVLIHQVIMKPWDVFKIEEDKIDKARLLNIGSLLYNVIMEVLKGLVPIFHHNQAFLSIDLKVKQKKTLLQALDLSEDEQKFNVQKEPTRDGEIIEGFYNKQQLACFFNDRKKYVDDLKSLVYGWLDCIFESTHEEGTKKTAAEKKAETEKKLELEKRLELDKKLEEDQK